MYWFKVLSRKCSCSMLCNLKTDDQLRMKVSSG